MTFKAWSVIVRMMQKIEVHVLPLEIVSLTFKIQPNGDFVKGHYILYTSFRSEIS